MISHSKKEAQFFSNTLLSQQRNKKHSNSPSSPNDHSRFFVRRQYFPQLRKLGIQRGTQKIRPKLGVAAASKKSLHTSSSHRFVSTW